jgi:hypothetical protein
MDLQVNIKAIATLQMFTPTNICSKKIKYKCFHLTIFTLSLFIGIQKAAIYG